MVSNMHLKTKTCTVCKIPSNYGMFRHFTNPNGKLTQSCLLCRFCNLARKEAVERRNGGRIRVRDVKSVFRAQIEHWLNLRVDASELTVAQKDDVLQHIDSFTISDLIRGHRATQRQDTHPHVGMDESVPANEPGPGPTPVQGSIDTATDQQSWVPIAPIDATLMPMLFSVPDIPRDDQSRANILAECNRRISIITSIATAYEAGQADLANLIVGNLAVEPEAERILSAAGVLPASHDPLPHMFG